MAFVIDVNTDELIAYSNKLERLSRRSLPKVVRSTLNSLAFDVKKNTMLKQSKRFENRDKNFFKANSRVNMAKSNDINSMQSEVGFLATGKTKNNKAVDELEQQEFGGIIQDRSMIPLKGARTAKNKRRKVARRNRISEIKKIVRTSDAPGRTEAEKFTRTIIMVGKGGVFMSNWKGRNIVWRVNSLNRSKGGKYKLTALYSYKKGRVAKIKKATHFMEKASKMTMKSADKFFIKEAEREFKKVLS